MTRAPWPRSDAGAALAHVAVAGHQRHLAADHDVGGPVDAVDQAVATAVEVVELRLGHRVVDVDGREEQLAGLHHLVQAMHAGRGLLGDALDALGDAVPELRLLDHGAAQELEDDGPLLGVLLAVVGDDTGALVLDPLVHEQGGVAAVIEDHVGTGAAGPAQDLLGAPPVLLEGLTLPGEHRHALGPLDRALGPDHDRGGGVVLGREDVAAGPPDLGTEGDERLDQHCGLDGHVQRAGDSGPSERLGVEVLGTQCHQPGHLVLGELDLLAPECGKGEVGHAVVEAVVGEQGGEGHSSLSGCGSVRAGAARQGFPDGDGLGPSDPRCAARVRRSYPRHRASPRPDRPGQASSGAARRRSTSSSTGAGPGSRPCSAAA